MGDLIVAGGIGAIAVMQGMILAKLNRIDGIEKKVNTLHQWAFGPNENNGADSDIKFLKTQMERRSGEDRRTA